ncbi:MAG: LmbE family N-acetylglucosaminyl deacetylase/CheY-like chemotaxis protein [Cognaticolwellia sp.]|jgi:LmbE family N-acetylglucosaminyl deacetylase/CheY-like chemotaxis protein
MNATARILLVEDDPSYSRLVQHWLRRAGYDVYLATNGTDGAELARNGGWDLVLSDVEMPGCSGFVVLGESKRAHPKVSAILMTAHDEVSLASAAVDWGVDAYLLKPVSRPKLLERVEQLVARQRSQATPVRVVLAIGAHPDDIEIGCGGTLLAHRAAGDEVVLLTLSKGAHGGQQEVRVEEARQAAQILGGTLVFGDLPDTSIRVDRSSIALIEDVVRRCKPSVVYTHSQNDLHQDHRAVHEATLIGARQVPTVLCYQAPSSNIQFCPRRFEDVGAHMQEKLALLGCYHSQKERCYLAPDMIESTARYWGRFASFGSVEPFEVLRAAGMAAAVS